MGTQFHGWPLNEVRYRLGRGYCNRARAPRCNQPTFPITRSSRWPYLPHLLRQHWHRHSYKQRPLSQPRDKQNPQAHLPAAGAAPDSTKSGSCRKPEQHLRCTLPWQYHGIPGQFPINQCPNIHPTAESPSRKASTIVAPVFTPPLAPQTPHTLPPSGGLLQLNDSPFWPRCRAEDRVFLWKGVNAAPASTISDPTIHFIATLASQASLCDAASYGSSLRKFHVFCDIFSIPEADHLPAPASPLLRPMGLN